ncbi:MAG: hypothetical protein Q4A06_03785 [Cardiobacteriaceae bacterium]|nr:hypothetical protein [Cardiobacteriaceae bacterium]
MHPWLIFLQIFPIIAVLLFLVVGRRPPWQAALAGVLAALVLWMTGTAQPYALPVAQAMASDAALLFASVAAVMAPGLLLVVLLAKTDANQALTAWVTDNGLTDARRLLFVVLGLAPALEALTGFGVSLIAVVPVLLATLPRRAALAIVFAGMAIMPWGTMGLATVTGAALVKLPPGALGAHSAVTSAPVFLALALLAVWLAGYRKWRILLETAALALFFVAVLHAASRWLGAEVAGMCAGTAVMALLLVGKRVTLPRAAWPYGLIFAGVLLLKGLWRLTGWADALVWQGAQVAYKPLNSPGVVLVFVAFIVWWRHRGEYRDSALAAAWLARAWRPLFTIFCFLVLSQIMVKGGFLDGVRELGARLDGAWLMPLLAGLGALGGYLTASAVGGNVLMMPSLAGGDLWQAALINSAAGHAALGALPMAALIAGLAKADRGEEQHLARFGLALVLLNTALLALAGMWIA